MPANPPPPIEDDAQDNPALSKVIERNIRTIIQLRLKASHDRGLQDRAADTIRGDFSESTWQAFWRSSIDGHATSEIAHDLGLSPAAVCMCRSRVLRRLRETLGDRPEYVRILEWNFETSPFFLESEYAGSNLAE